MLFPWLHSVFLQYPLRKVPRAMASEWDLKAGFASQLPPLFEVRTAPIGFVNGLKIM
jgi:hypothetical protein